MAEIISSLEPGYYTTGQTLTVTFPANSRRAIVTRTERNPVLTEILAYDRGPITPVPPGPNPGPTIDRPFLAVTQDGRGNVIYDGGFPKFYNNQLAANNGGTYPATLPNTFATLTPAQKYLYNGLNFIANPRKVAAGNRKVLFIGDCIKGETFVLTDSHYNPTAGQSSPDGPLGFKDTLTGIVQAGNWTATYYEPPNASTKIDFDFNYLDQYAAVVFFGLKDYADMASLRVTDRFAKELAAYRSAGNGIAIITDHCGDNYTSLQDAVSRGSIFAAAAILLAKEYGCYFSGNVDRSPVLVSEIKRQIGAPGPPQTHPLLNGLPDSASIYAGVSESLVMPELYTDEAVDPTQALVIPMTTAGKYRVNVLVQLNDGTIITKPMLFTVIDPSAVTVRDSFNRSVLATSTTYKPVVDYGIGPDPAFEGTLRGKIQVDGNLVGFFQTSVTAGVGNTAYLPFGGSGNPMPVKNGSVLKFSITDPFEYSLTTTISIPNVTPYWEASGGISTFINQILQHPYFTGKTVAEVQSDITLFADKCYTTAKSLGTTTYNQWWKVMGKMRLPFASSELTPVRVQIYANLASFNTNKPAVGAIGDAVIIADTNQVYYWDDLPIVWTLHPVKADVLFNVGRKAVNTLNASNWVIGANSTVGA
jgi:hypothetical protein